MEAERKACLLLIDALLRELTQEVHMGNGTHCRAPSELITQGAAVLPGSERGLMRGVRILSREERGGLVALSELGPNRRPFGRRKWGYWPGEGSRKKGRAGGRGGVGFSPKVKGHFTAPLAVAMTTSGRPRGGGGVCRKVFPCRPQRDKDY